MWYHPRCHLFYFLYLQLSTTLIYFLGEPFGRSSQFGWLIMLYLLFISGLMWLIILAYEGSYSIWASAGVMQPIVDILMAMLPDSRSFGKTG